MSLKKKVLFICTGNACRSQIAHGLLKDMASDYYETFSAGLQPSQVHQISILVMEEIGIDISKHTSNSIDDYLDKRIDIVITVCDEAKEACPVFPSEVKQQHWSIEDPFKNSNFDLNQLNSFRETRENIRLKLKEFIESDTFAKN